MDINVTAPICSTGYGIASYNIIKELSKKNDVTLYPISGNIEFKDDFIIEAIDRQIEPSLDAPSIKIWHQDQLQEFVGHGDHIGFPIFELDTFTPLEKSSLLHCDKLFVCSKWAKDVILNNLPEFNESQVSVIPLGVDSSLFSSANPKHRSTTVFFNCGKWEVRKGHDILVECFNEAFDDTDDVELWMMCENPFPRVDNDGWNKLYTQSSLRRKIRIIPRMPNHKDVYNIMRQTDCGVFPSRAEGWNLEALEMMACGKHVIITDYSAHTEFCNQDNSCLVEIDETEVANDGVWFSGQGNWAKIGDKQKKKVVEYMRQIHESKQSGTLSPNVDGVFTANKYSWKNTAREIINAI